MGLSLANPSLSIVLTADPEAPVPKKRRTQESMCCFLIENK
jgi:hypothetical protein